MKVVGIQESQDTAATFIQNAIRHVFVFIDKTAFWLLGLMYQIFFNVATADLFNSEIILDFYKRFQLIIGVFMVFQLALLILRGIMDPEQVTDKKAGAGSFVKRVIISLTLLTVLTPISIPNPSNDYEKQLNNNGLLFGTLYSLQERILENNTLGRLILGSNSSQSTESSTTEESGVDKKDKTNEDLKEAADVFASTVLKGFVRINLRPNWEEHYKDNGKIPETQNDCRMCTDITDAQLNAYTPYNADPQEILDMVTDTCKPDIDWETNKKNKERYVFTYRGLIGGAVALVFALILLSFTIDVVIRGVKLVILRLLAPIPIISYMDPKGGKDSAFNAWGKLLISTYLDLFIRLSIVYFAIALIQDMIKKGIGMDAGGGVIMILSYILIFLGIFAFAKEAPKFIREMLGMKGDGGKLFGGLSAAMGIGAAAAGTAGAFNIARKASLEADKTNGKNAGSLLNRGKHLAAGIAGGAIGFGTGVKASWGAKDHNAKAAFDAIQKRNAIDISRGKNGSTLLGRTGTIAERMLRGEDTYERLAAEAKTARAQEKTGKDLFSYLEGKGKTDGAGWKVSTAKFSGQANGMDFKDRSFNGTLNELLQKKQEAIAKQHAGTGDGTFEFDGVTFNATDASVGKLEEELAYAAGTVWAEKEEAKGKNADMGYTQKRDDYATVGGEFSYTQDADGIYSGVSKLKKAQKKAGGRATHIESSKEYMKAEADHGATGGKK